MCSFHTLIAFCLLNNYRYTMWVYKETIRFSISPYNKQPLGELWESDSTFILPETVFYQVSLRVPLDN